ncbi:MAG: hypothetical protein ACC642_00075, partial [Pseudomonadales bacterium]
RFLATPAEDGTEEFARLVTQADRLGVKLSPGQLANDPVTRQLEASLGSFPLTGAIEQTRKQSNRRVVNNVFAKALGLDQTGEITEGMLGRVFNRLDDDFKEVARDMGQIELDDDLLQGLIDIQTQSTRLPLAGDRTARVVDSLVDISDTDVLGVVKYDAAQFMGIRSELNREMRGASVRGEGGYAARLRDILSLMDDTVLRQAGADVGAKYANTRAAYRLVDALDAGNVIRNGNIMTGRAATVLKKRYPAEFGRGNQYGNVLDQALLDAFDVIRIGNRFGDIVGDSGTATRMSIQNMINNPQGTVTGQLIAGAVSATIAPVSRAVGVGAEAFAGGVAGGADSVVAQILAGALAPEAARASAQQ